MQGQRSTIQSLPETFEFDHGSTSTNPGMDQQLYWNNMLNPIDAHSLPDYLLSPSDTNIACTNAVSHENGSLSGWSLDGPSSSSHSLSQSSHDESKFEHGWTPSLTSSSGPGLSLEERRFEPTNILSLESVNINLNSDHIVNGPLSFQNCSADDIPQSSNINTGFVGNGVQAMEAGILAHSYKQGGSESEQILSASGSSTDHCAITSGTVEFHGEDSNGRPGCLLDGRRLSCKRKALEGVSGQSSLGAGSSCFQRAENSVWPAVSLQHNAASSSSTAEPLSSVNPLDGQFNTRFGVGMRVLGSDCQPVPGLIVAGNAESSQRNFRMRINPAQYNDPASSNVWPPGSNIQRSHVWSPLQPSPRLLPYNQSMDSRPAATGAGSHQAQSPVPHNPGFLPCSLHHYPCNMVPNARAGSLSNCPVISQERPSALMDEASSRSMPRSITEHPMFVPTTDMRYLTRDPTNWSLANGYSSLSGNSNSSRISSSSVVHLSPSPTWVPHQNPPGQYPHRRLSEAVRRSLFPSSGSESGAQSSNFSSLLSTPSTSSHEMVLPPGGVHQGHQPPPYPRSSFWMDRQGDGVLGVPLSFCSRAAAPEGRSRLASEIRNVLDLVRRGEHLRFEDVLILDQSVFYGVADLHDRHRDMRLDVDNMSYEELLALEERIGNVSTGLTEEAVLKCLKQRNYVPLVSGTHPEDETCCICQEEYVESDELATLDCGHDFHAGCIKQWLMHKNLCPICKATGLVT